MSGNSLHIKLAEPLVSGTEYTLTLLPETKTQDGISIIEAQNITFMTTAQALDIANPSLTVDSTLKFNGTLIDSSNSVSVRLIVVIYGADGRIQQVNIGDELQGGSFETEVDFSQYYTAKIFCITSDFQNVIGEKIFTYIGG